MSHRIAVIAFVTAAARVASADEPAPDQPVSVDEAPPPPAPAPPAATEPVPAAPEVTPPVPAPAPAAPGEPAIAPPHPDDTGFRFGSYGRISAGTDLRGHTPEPVAVIAHPPRVVEKSYLELEFQYRFATPRAKFHTVATVAWGDRLFHYTGDFDAQPALRNFYGEAELDGGATLWVGSRMYRGDDIYLFDYWPLDDQNTVGGGGSVRTAKAQIAAHVGFNRLNNDLQYQTKVVPDPAQGATTVTQLDRQRLVASASAIYRFLDGEPAGSSADATVRQWSAAAKLHGELQGLPSGTRLLDDHTPQKLPRDWGTTLGVELKAWQHDLTTADALGRRSRLNRHVAGFARWSKGLTAYDELQAATSLDVALKTFPHASELVFGLSGAWDAERWNVLVGAQSRRFLGAGPGTADPNAGWEYAFDVRPLGRIAGDFYGGADLSYQARFPRGLNATAILAEDPGVVQIAPMLVYAPMGPSAYDRPQLRLVYRAAHLNRGALDLYVPDDPRHARPWVHFLGVQAEWWFNSSSY